MRKGERTVTLHAQNKSPGVACQSNRLLTFADPRYLAMRLHWPKTAPASFLPPGEGTWQPRDLRRDA